MINTARLNEQNWQNLIELYRSVADSSSSFIVKNEPIESYYSEKYVWPNFSVLEHIEISENHTAHMVKNLIENGIVSPFILVEPSIQGNTLLYDELNNLGIRQVAQWPLLLYKSEAKKSIVGLSKDLSVLSVNNDNDRYSWQRIAENVLFQCGKLPLSQLSGDRFELILGTSCGIPVATALAYFGSLSASVHMVAVLPEFRRHGFGQQIFMEAISRCRKMGYEKIFTQSSQMGLRAWSEIGFEATGEIDVFWMVGKK